MDAKSLKNFMNKLPKFWKNEKSPFEFKGNFDIVKIEENKFRLFAYDFYPSQQFPTADFHIRDFNTLKESVSVAIGMINQWKV